MIRVQMLLYVPGLCKVCLLIWLLVPGIGKPYPTITDTKDEGMGRVCAAANDPLSITCSTFPGFIVLQPSLTLGHIERLRD
jgi:hypothetical protein